MLYHWAPVKTPRSDIVLNVWIGWMLDALAGPQMCVPYITKLVWPLPCTGTVWFRDSILSLEEDEDYELWILIHFSWFEVEVSSLTVRSVLFQYIRSHLLLILFYDPNPCGISILSTKMHKSFEEHFTLVSLPGWSKLKRRKPHFINKLYIDIGFE